MPRKAGPWLRARGEMWMMTRPDGRQVSLGITGAHNREAAQGGLRRSPGNATGVEIEAHRKDLTDRTAKSLLQDGGLVIDTFDNSASRRSVQQQCRALQLPCLHVGLFADYAEVMWDERYRVPQNVGVDVCDYPLARNLVLLAVAVASEWERRRGRPLG